MKELFKVNELSFYEEDFLDDINEYLDIVDILRDMQSELSYEKVTCATQNDCCEKSKDNYFIQVHGFINKEDEFITKEEVDMFAKNIKQDELDLFVIRVYKCTECGKWIIDILE